MVMFAAHTGLQDIDDIGLSFESCFLARAESSLCYLCWMKKIRSASSNYSCGLMLQRCPKPAELQFDWRLGSLWRCMNHGVAYEAAHGAS